MKVILLILLVAVGGISFMQINKAKTQAITAQVELKAVKAELTQTQNDLRTAETDLDRLRRETSDARERAAAANAMVDGAASAAAAQRLSKEELDAKLVQLKAVYDTHNREIVAQRAVLTTNLNKANSALGTLRNNTPKFTEHGERYSVTSGNHVATGVRMSQADRALVIEKHNEQVNQLSDQVAAIQGELMKVEARSHELETNYRAAVNRAGGF